MNGYIYRVILKISYHKMAFDFPGAVDALEFIHAAKSNYKALEDKDKPFKVVMLILDPSNVQDIKIIRGCEDE